MKVMIGEKIYTEEDGPIVVYLNDYDKENIANMGPENSCYMIYEDDIMTQNEAREYIIEAKKTLMGERTNYIQIPLYNKLLEEFLGEPIDNFNIAKMKARIYDYINEKYKSTCLFVYYEILSEEDKKTMFLNMHNGLEYFTFLGDRKTKMFFNDLVIECKGSNIDVKFDFILRSEEDEG